MTAVDALFRSGQRLPESVRAEIVALGEAAVAPLVRIVRDRSTWLEESEGGGQAPVHAAGLLAALRAEGAIPDLVDALADTSPFQPMFSALISALRDLGPPVLEPLLALADGSDDDEILDAVAEVLCEIGVRDERIFTLLLGRLEARTDLGATFLGLYGDSRALPHLHDAFAKLEPSDVPRLAQPEVEVAQAIEALGGELLPTERDRLDAIGAQAAAFRRTLERAREPEEQPYVRARPKLGRNEKCWCGSGKKYKRCHYDADRA